MNWNILARNHPTSKSTLGFLVAVATATGLCLHGNLTGEAWADLMQWVVPAFMGTEAARKFAKTEPAA